MLHVPVSKFSVMPGPFFLKENRQILKLLTYCNVQLYKLSYFIRLNPIRALTRDFQQCGILTSVDSDGPVQPPFKLRNVK